MREIKFRAWNDARQEMDEYFYINSINGNPCYNNYDEMSPLLDYFVMPCTGYKDKNGEDIYEDDIIIDKDGIKHKVELEYFYYDIHEHLLNPLECEIIGNIYENEELLNEDT